MVVNGERMRVAPLPHSAELWVGRFLIGCTYQSPPSPSPSGRLATVPPPSPLPQGKSGKLATTSPNNRPASSSSADARIAVSPAPFPLPPAQASSETPEDEIELGVPPPDGEGLPNSHIMADVFRLKGPIRAKDVEPDSGFGNRIAVAKFAAGRIARQPDFHQMIGYSLRCCGKWPTCTAAV